jgi:hypothetical protein
LGFHPTRKVILKLIWGPQGFGASDYQYSRPTKMQILGKLLHGVHPKFRSGLRLYMNVSSVSEK